MIHPRTARRNASMLLALTLAGCGSETTMAPASDAGAGDGAMPSSDAASSADASALDAGSTMDAGTADSGTLEDGAVAGDAGSVADAGLDAWASLDAASPVDAGSDAGPALDPPLLHLQIGGTGTDEVEGLAVDAMDRILVALTLRGTADYGGGPRSSRVSFGVTTSDPAMALYDASGTHVYSAVYGTADDSFSSSVAFRPGGGLALSGGISGSGDFGGGSLGGPFDERDGFIAGFGGAGAHAFSRRFRAPGTRFGSAPDVAVDASGNVYVIASFQGTVTVDDGMTLTSAGDTDTLLVKLDSMGAFVWARRIGGTGRVIGQGVAVDSSGRVHVFGHFSGQLDYGEAPVTSAGGFDLFLATLDGMGARLRSATFGGPFDELAAAVTVDGTGNTYVTGSFTSSTLDLGGGVLPVMAGGDVFVASFDTAGMHRFSRAYGSFAADSSTAIAVDAVGNLAVAGYFQAEIEFGGSPLMNRGLNDGFVASFDATGAHRLSRAFGSPGTDFATAVAFDSMGDLVVGGYVAGEVDFGAGPVASRGGTDGFVVVLEH